jgi:DNA-binding response OmpR family regulator
MEMQMPLMDGYAVTREIRSRNCDVPIIALVPHGTEIDEQACRAAGCIGRLSKPFGMEAMVSVLQRLLPTENTPSSAAEPIERVPTVARPKAPYMVDRRAHSLAPMGSRC